MIFTRLASQQNDLKGAGIEPAMGNLQGQNQVISSNLELHTPHRERFLEAMVGCSRVVTTGGFDTIAEAFYTGVPVFMLPTLRHYEQYCNVLDATRTGMAYQLEHIEELNQPEFEPVSNGKFRKWVDNFSLVRTLEELQASTMH